MASQSFLLLRSQRISLYHNNPASVANNERKFLWPDVAESLPDIFLSLGTGKYGQRLEEQIAELDPPPGGQQQTTRSSIPHKTVKSNRKTNPNWKKGNSRNRIARFFDVLVNRIDNILNAEVQWKYFRNETSAKQGQGQESRYIRLNLDLWCDPPKMDENDKLAELQELGARLLKTDEYRNIVERIAHTLVASTFYFSKERFWYNEDSGTWTCAGRIVCRFEGKFPDSQNNMRALGDHLRHQQSSAYQPYFTVKDDIDDPDRIQIPITGNTIENMINRAEFRLDGPLYIDVPSQLSSTTIYLRMRGIQSEQSSCYPISGFPRNLIAEDTMNETHLNKRAELIKERRYGGLAIASDPKVAISGDDDSAPKTPTNETQSSTGAQGAEERPLAKADSAKSADTTTSPATRTGRATNSRASSQTLVSQLSTGQRVSIADLRVQAQDLVRDGGSGPKTIEDGDKLASTVSASLSLGGNGVGVGVGEPDFGSDDSDGPPSENEKETD